MNEINFFEVSKRRLEIKFDFKYKQYILPIAILVLLAIFIIMYVMMSKDVSSLEAKVSVLETEKTALQYPTISNQNNKDSSELIIKRESVDLIEGIENTSVVSEDVLLSIKESVPSSLFLEELYIENGVLNIKGYALSSNIIARFQNNLEKKENISDVFVSNIVADYGNYYFTITANVGR